MVPALVLVCAATATADDGSALWGAHYQGTAKVALNVYDYCGSGNSRRLAGSRTYAMPATLDFGKPMQGGGPTEGNPFSLALSVGDPSQQGAMTFKSAQAYNVSSGQALLTYWKLQWDGSKIEGSLTDDHTREAAALNLVNWPTPLVPCRPELGPLPNGYPHPMSTGTAIAGQVTKSSAALAAKGSTGDLDFELQFNGNA